MRPRAHSSFLFPLNPVILPVVLVTLVIYLVLKFILEQDTGDTLDRKHILGSLSDMGFSICNCLFIIYIQSTWTTRLLCALPYFMYLPSGGGIKLTNALNPQS